MLVGYFGELDCENAQKLSEILNSSQSYDVRCFQTWTPDTETFPEQKSIIIYPISPDTPELENLALVSWYVQRGVQSGRTVGVYIPNFEKGSGCCHPSNQIRRVARRSVEKLFTPEQAGAFQTLEELARWIQERNL